MSSSNFIRWAALLLIIGTVSALLVLLLPKQGGRMTVIPVGLGLIWLGYALWSEKSERATATVVETNKQTAAA